MLNIISKNLTFHTADMLYKSYILPIFDFCDTVWTKCGQREKDALEGLQKRAGKIIYQLKISEVHQHGDEVLQYLNWMKLEDQRDMHVFKAVNKCLNQKSPQFMHDYFGHVTARERRQRARGLLYYPKVKLEFAKNGFFYHGC